jgi:iron complex outermembrane recepter protein
MLSAALFAAERSAWAEEEIQTLEEVQVEAVPNKSHDLDAGQPTVVLKGDVLTQKNADTLGATLEQEQGLNNASFGPGVGQPVVRGLGGPRVQMLQDGLNTLDASQFSGDHANAVEPLLAEEIEVFKGPTSLLYGGTAIGGAVNVIDRRVPSSLPSAPLTGAFGTRYNSVLDETSSVMKVDTGQDHVALHLDGFYRQNGNMTIPGNAINDAAYAQMNGGALPQVNTRGYLGNSAGNAIGGTVGLSWVDDWGYSGASYNNRNDYYGIPPDGSKGSPKVNIAQNVSRADFKTEWLNPSDLFNKASLRFAYSDYTHYELDDGAVAATFTNQGYEGRMEIEQKAIGPLGGKFGIQTQNNQFNVVAGPGTLPVGAPPLAPLTNIQNYAGFMVERLDVDQFTTEAGVRVESSILTPQSGSDPARSYLPVSASISQFWHVDAANDLKLTLSRSQRAPQVQELYFDGYHDATNSVEIGNTNLQMETSYNIELGYALRSEDWGNLDFSLFQNQFNNYIYMYDTGSTADPNLFPYNQCPSQSSGCVPVYQYAQQNAVFRGYEVNYHVPITQQMVPGRFAVDLFSDFTRGIFTQGGDVPRMPPLRYGLQLNYDIDHYSFNSRLTRANAQDYAGENQTTTPGYILWNVAAQYHLKVEDHDVMLFARGNNLLDQTIRSSVSYLRVYAPQAGRGAEIGIQIQF